MATGTEPDGPFEADGFRFAGVEVRFGRATLQYRLLMALWNYQRGQPSPPQEVEALMTAVYGEDHETADSTFRQLCSDTRNRLQKASFPLGISAQTNGKVQLTEL